MNGDNIPFFDDSITLNNAFDYDVLHKESVSTIDKEISENSFTDSYHGLQKNFYISESHSFNFSLNLQENNKTKRQSSTRNSWGDETYSDLIIKAIKSSSDQKLILSEIYEWITKSFPSIPTNSPNWKNSVRHNLSLHKVFEKTKNEENGKSSWWTVNNEELKRLTDKKNKIANKTKPKPKIRVKPKITSSSNSFRKNTAESNKRKSCDKSHLERKMSKSNTQSSSGSTSDFYHDFKNVVKLDYRNRLESSCSSIPGQEINLDYQNIKNTDDFLEQDINTTPCYLTKPEQSLAKELPNLTRLLIGESVQPDNKVGNGMKNYSQFALKQTVFNDRYQTTDYTSSQLNNCDIKYYDELYDKNDDFSDFDNFTFDLNTDLNLIEPAFFCK